MGRISDWVNRQRHNRGYGIQSPSEFFFVTQVLREHLPYYAYTLLDTIATKENCNSKKLKELFRITNHHHPANCIAIGSPSAACAMSAARPSAVKHCITHHPISEYMDAALIEHNCRTSHGKVNEQLVSTLDKVKAIGILYIGNCPEYSELLETALRYIGDKSIIIVEGIHRNKEIEKWWEKVVKSHETVVTYDMGSSGLLYFNKDRRKQHYTLKR